SGLETDFILGENEVAIEVKGADFIHARHLKGLKALSEEYLFKRKLLVSADPEPRTTAERIEILPWKIFLDKLWSGEII
ncbi:MAG: hypothetical protein N2747_10630, partial [Chitinophagaceae bacterium]|nr:hypothetical protein [Chitinophagaceae bacterium]